MLSIASISYDSLKDASDAAKDVAKKLDRYSDSLYDSVYKKLNSYSGPWSNNLTSAREKTNDKITDLREEAERYNKFSRNLISLNDECQKTDSSVRTKISTLTASFKNSHGIRNSSFENSINYLLTKFGNKTAFGRWLGDGIDDLNATKDSIKQKIKDWYNFEGGKEWLKGTADAFLDIALGVIGVISAILAIASGGALIVAVAALVAGAIATANGVVNLINEQRAYNHTQNNDPALGRRRSSEDTLQDTIRAESSDKNLHLLASGIDAASAVCTLVSLASGGGDLLKKGYKWATGSADDISKIKIKDVLTRDTGKTFLEKLKTSVTDGFKDITSTIKNQNWGAVKDTAKGFATDFWNNLKRTYSDFSDFEKGLETTENILETTQDLIENGLGKESLKDIAVPNIPIAKLAGDDDISFRDFIDVIDNGIDIKSNFTDAFKDGSPMINDKLVNKELLDKLSKPNGINISIPNIYIPQFVR